MSNLMVLPNWNNEINQVDVSEPILGGDGGNANLAPRQLAENVLWLKQNMQALVPMGYIYHSHDGTNPKPKFDTLLGIETHWRRVSGKVMVGTSPTDPFIKEVGAVVGQKGMTTAAGLAMPGAYSLQATNIFERYDPNVTLVPTYAVYANKQAVGGGSSIEFTITGVNTPESPAVNYIITEGILNETGAEITVPDTEVRGTALLVDGVAIVQYDTVKDMAVDPARHVIFMAAAPVDDVVILPIVEDTVVAKLSFVLNMKEQSLSQGSMTWRTPAFATSNVSESSLRMIEFDANGRRYHTGAELNAVQYENRAWPPVNNDEFRLSHIWIHLPNEFADPALYTVTAVTNNPVFLFNVVMVVDQVYGGLYKGNTPAGEQAHQNWIQLKTRMDYKNPASYNASNLLVTVTVTRKA